MSTQQIFHKRRISSIAMAVVQLFSNIRTVVLIFGFILTLSITACGSNDSDAVSKEAGSSPNAGVLVETTDLVRTTHAVTLELIGTLEPQDRVDLAFQFGGPIGYVGKEEGDPVKKMDLIANLVLDNITAQVKQAQVGLDIAKRNYKRNKKLHAEGALSDQMFKDSASDVEAKQAAWEVADANYRVSHLRSPIAGVIAFSSLEVGMITTPGKPMVTVMNTEVLHLTAGVPEDQVARIASGQEVMVSVGAFPGQSFPGKVARVGIAADDRTRLFPVEIHIPNADGTLRPGMTGRVSILTETVKDIYVIPVGATREDKGQRYILVADNGTTARRINLPSPRIYSQFVLAPLREESGTLTLITMGQHKLVDGSTVRIYDGGENGGEPPA